MQIVDAATADAARRSGDWLACRPGCSQCCVGPFAISQLDAVRLQEGLAELERTDPVRAAAIRRRARESVARLSAEFPGDPQTGLLNDAPEADAAFDEFANDEPCPVLDPATGTCDLYSARPMTCRLFGPPVRSDGGLGVCELCFHGATAEQIAACEVNVDPDELEAPLVREIQKETGTRGNTIVAFCLR
ncbi:MAG TPA: YkgJ family cysteine cluster protein [Terriglobales bacterium]|nr:YkgJ family cysteine cluster protein [Terriglobales bacterium]